MAATGQLLENSLSVTNELDYLPAFKPLPISKEMMKQQEIAKQ